MFEFVHQIYISKVLKLKNLTQRWQMMITNSSGAGYTVFGMLENLFRPVTTYFKYSLLTFVRSSTQRTKISEYIDMCFK